MNADAPDCCTSAQRRPERQLRRHSPTAYSTASAHSPLNEGRSVNSGDTPNLAEQVALAVGRSTKAGASTPATPFGVPSMKSDSGPAQRRPERQLRRHQLIPLYMYVKVYGAQRRPERQLRRHVTLGPGPVGERGRSTKAGASTPATLKTVGFAGVVSTAQRRPERQLRRHTPGNIAKSYTTLAQRRPERQLRRHAHTMA